MQGTRNKIIQAVAQLTSPMIRKKVPGVIPLQEAERSRGLANRRSLQNHVPENTRIYDFLEMTKMFQKSRDKSRVCCLLFVMVLLITQVQCELKEKGDTGRNYSSVGRKTNEGQYDNLEELSKALTSMLFTGRKKGGGGGGMGMFFMRTLMDMFNATVPMMAMTVLGWMKDIMLMGAGAFMMMMYDMLNNNGKEKKIIIKLAQPPPEPAPPAQTGYGPWEG